MSDSPEFDLGPLVGSWRIQSAGITWSDTGERIEPFGSDPVGWMVLEPSGRIMFLFGKSDRQPPSSDADRARLFDLTTAYSGRVRREGADRFITMVDLSLHPGMSGDQVRFFTLKGDSLIVRTPEQTLSQFGDRLLVADLVWRREH